MNNSIEQAAEQYADLVHLSDIVWMSDEEKMEYLKNHPDGLFDLWTESKAAFIKGYNSANKSPEAEKYWREKIGAQKTNNWIGFREAARLNAESKMPDNWDRQDVILIAAFYNHYIEYMFNYFSSKLASGGDKEDAVALLEWVHKKGFCCLDNEWYLPPNYDTQYNHEQLHSLYLNSKM